jgi:hypothetical protein
MQCAALVARYTDNQSEKMMTQLFHVEFYDKARTRQRCDDEADALRVLGSSKGAIWYSTLGSTGGTCIRDTRDTAEERERRSEAGLLASSTSDETTARPKR